MAAITRITIVGEGKGEKRFPAHFGERGGGILILRFQHACTSAKVT
jgi:hypothetical protein